MTEQSAPKTIIIAGRVLGFTPPTQGQLESMVRIARTLQRGTDDDSKEFWQTQIYRVGTLLESLINEGDRETLDELYLTGKTNSNELMAAILAALKLDEAADAELAPETPKKANKARVRR